MPCLRLRLSLDIHRSSVQSESIETDTQNKLLLCYRVTKATHRIVCWMPKIGWRTLFLVIPVPLDFFFQRLERKSINWLVELHFEYVTHQRYLLHWSHPRCWRPWHGVHITVQVVATAQNRRDWPPNFRLTRATRLRGEARIWNQKAIGVKIFVSWIKGWKPLMFKKNYDKK